MPGPGPLALSTHRTTSEKERQVAPVEIDLLWNAVRIRPTGWHRLWSLRRAVEVPYEQIVSVEHRPELARKGPVGARMPGSRIGRRYNAGTFWKYWEKPHEWSFWVCRHPEQTITLTLRGHRFGTICVEVDDPNVQVERLRNAIAEQSQLATPKS